MTKPENLNQNIVYTKEYHSTEAGGSIPVDRAEIWRYSGYAKGAGQAEPALVKLFDEAITETLPILTYRVCFLRLALIRQNGIPVLPFSVASADLVTCLADHTEAVCFAATVGLELDRRIERSLRVSPTKALFLQAIGTERIEALCDFFCTEMKQAGKAGARFSPGYGDFPLETQREIFRLLDCPRKIGLTLNKSLLMSPMKSVTAVFGFTPYKTDNADK